MICLTVLHLSYIWAERKHTFLYYMVKAHDLSHSELVMTCTCKTIREILHRREERWHVFTFTIFPALFAQRVHIHSSSWLSSFRLQYSLPTYKTTETTQCVIFRTNRSSVWHIIRKSSDLCVWWLRWAVLKPLCPSNVKEIFRTEKSGRN